MLTKSQFFATAQAVILVVNACVGDLGKHQPLDAQGYVQPSPKLMRFQELEYVSFLTFVPALFFAKLSILHLYNRLFNVEQALRFAIIGTYAVNVAWAVAFFSGYIFKCWPISNYWLTENNEGNCLPSSFNYAFAFSNVMLDTIILVMPLPIVWKLNMAWRQKIAVTGIFLLGSIVVVLSIAKAVAFFYAFEEAEHNNDISWDEAPLFYYSVPEALVAVISACLPTLRPLFRNHLSNPIVENVLSLASSPRSNKKPSSPAKHQPITVSFIGTPLRHSQYIHALPRKPLPRPSSIGADQDTSLSRQWYALSPAEQAMPDIFTVDLKQESVYWPGELSPTSLSSRSSAGSYNPLLRSRIYDEEWQPYGADGTVGLGISAVPLVELASPEPVQPPSPLGRIAERVPRVERERGASPPQYRPRVDGYF